MTINPDPEEPDASHRGILSGMSTTQIAVRLADELLAAIDALVTEGDADSRADAVRTALERYVKAHEEAQIDAQIIAGYMLIPAGTPDEWGDLDKLGVLGTSALMRRMDEEERESGFEPW